MNAKHYEWIEHSGILLGKMKTNEIYYIMHYNSRVDVVCMLTERSDTKSNLKLGGSTPASNILRVYPHWRVVIQRNSLSVDDNIYVYICTRVCVVESPANIYVYPQKFS